MRFFYFALVILYTLSHSFAQQQPVSCGTSDNALPQSVLNRMAILPNIMQQQKARLGAGEMNVCRIAIEVDYQTYLSFEKDTNAIFQKVLNDVEKVSTVYQKEINTRMVVTNIRIFKDPATDPFGKSDNIFTLLDILVNLAPANQNFDKRAYFYTKPVTGEASGVALIGGVASVSRLDNPLTMMHEFGHNFASPHTHNCSWPGGPIDFCASAEGDCYDKALELLSDRSGTIMSYCYAEPTFHPLSQAIMRDHADITFSKILTAPDVPKLNANMQVSKGDFLFWPVVSNALSYEVSYASNPDFSDGKTISVPFNSFHVKGLNAGATVFVKIRAINTFGSSQWSNAVNLKINTDQLTKPDLTTPATPPIVQRDEMVSLSYSEVPGATSYEIQIAYNHDTSFDYPFFKAVSTSTTFQHKADYTRAVRWRVRAINNEGKGKWSETGYFSVNLGPEYQPNAQISQNALTSFPFSYNPLIPNSRVKISVADNPAFDNASFAREYSKYGNIQGEIIDVVSNLPANHQLYFRIEEWNQNEFYFPLKKIVDYILPFKTGNTAWPDNLVYLSGLNSDVFDRSHANIAVTKENLWVASPSKGFVRVNVKDLSHQVFNQKNADGQIGYYGLDIALQTDDSLKLHIMSRESKSSYRRLKLAGETPDNNGLVTKLNHTGYLQDYSPTHNIHWEDRTLYKEENLTLVPFKTIEAGWHFRKVMSAAGKIWALAGNNDGRADLIVLDPVSGAEVERINANTQPELLRGIQNFVVAPGGRLMILQYDTNFNGYRLALRENQKWSISNTPLAPFNGSTVQSIACSPAGEFYVITVDEQTRVFKYRVSGWAKLGADIPLRIFATRVVPDLNGNIWLSDQYGVSRLSISQLSLLSTDKPEYCTKDSITLTMNIGGKVNASEPFTVTMKKPGGETNAIPNLFAIHNTLRFMIPSGFTGPDVELRVKSSEPEISSDNALRITVRELPTATLSVNKSVLIPLADTIAVSIKLTGEKPWAFTIWNGDSVSTELATYTRPYVLQNPLGENLSISGLRDRYCYSRNVGNSIQIQANLITGVSEPSWPKVKVYPNPSADRILLEFEQHNNRASKYYIADQKGVIVDSIQIREKLTEWNISKLSAGTYVLWTVHDGNKRSWKIVKN